MVVSDPCLFLCAAFSGGVIIGFWLAMAAIGELYDLVRRDGR